MGFLLPLQALRTHLGESQNLADLHGRDGVGDVRAKQRVVQAGSLVDLPGETAALAQAALSKRTAHHDFRLDSDALAGDLSRTVWVW